jgi:hypothetical protein
MWAVGLDAGGKDAGLFDFRPNAARTRQVAARVREGLAESLEAAFRALGEQRSTGTELLAQMRAGPIAPRVFGAYTELVEAIFAEDSTPLSPSLTSYAPRISAASTLCAW